MSGCDMLLGMVSNTLGPNGFGGAQQKMMIDTERRYAFVVNLDEERVKLMTYQQAYSASGRLVQAASDMFSTLLTMMGG